MPGSPWHGQGELSLFSRNKICALNALWRYALCCSKCNYWLQQYLVLRNEGKMSMDFFFLHGFANTSALAKGHSGINSHDL